MNPKDEMFVQEKLVDLIKQNTNLSPDEITNLIQNGVELFEKRKNNTTLLRLSL